MYLTRQRKVASSVELLVRFGRKWRLVLPKQSPWLNAIEPKWIHGKRKVVEADGVLGAYELAERVCRVFECPHYEHLTVPQKVAWSCTRHFGE